MMLLHGEQYLELKEPLPAAGRLRTVPRIIDIKVHQQPHRTCLLRVRAVAGCVARVHAYMFVPMGRIFPEYFCGSGRCVVFELRWYLGKGGSGHERFVRGVAAATAGVPLTRLIRMHM